MSKQVSLDGFESPHEKESVAINEMLPQLRDAAIAMGASANGISIKRGRSYSSIWYGPDGVGSVLAFRLRLRDQSRYLEVSPSCKAIVQEYAPSAKQTKSGFWRVNLGDSSVSDYLDFLMLVFQDAINRIPKAWDCCSRYMECSDAKRCVHPNASSALVCGYRKILSKGKIFYGKNRNVD